MRYLIISLFILCAININAQSSYKCEGTTYSSTGGQERNSVPQATPYTWKDSKGKTYTIYISNSGSCYVIKKSNKTGKDYKMYMKPEISKDICNKLGKEYKSKKK